MIWDGREGEGGGEWINNKIIETESLTAGRVMRVLIKHFRY